MSFRRLSLKERKTYRKFCCLIAFICFSGVVFNSLFLGLRMDIALVGYPTNFQELISLEKNYFGLLKELILFLLAFRTIAFFSTCLTAPFYTYEEKQKL